ncbi:hypothetical protein N9N28_15730 [Rubripirellula amarantea]|nr:hypothetical protein [Rubripirellula amarantea]
MKTIVCLFSLLFSSIVVSAAYAEVAGEAGLDEQLQIALDEFDHEFDGSFAWWGKVYDPQSGGFFYSISSKHSDQYGPFIEATAKAIHVLDWTGMMEQTSPAFRTGVIHYFQSRQDPETGFFRDPDYENQYSHNMLTRALGMSLGALETCVENRSTSFPSHELTRLLRQSSIISTTNLQKRLPLG